jgi:hypothetical protein
MRTISTDGYPCTGSVTAGSAPQLQWLPISDLIVDPAYQRPIGGSGRASITQTARSFQWSYFAPVVVAALEDGKFAIIDGQRRATAAALAGFDKVPCQIVVADHQQQALANKIINGAIRSNSRMAVHKESLTSSEPCAVRLAELCARAGVEVLRYPVPVDRQGAGQTMAIAALAHCLERYGEETLITALQCVTQTINNQPGVLTGRMIKGLCLALNGDHERRDSGLALLEAFDEINLVALQEAAGKLAKSKNIRPVLVIADLLHHEFARVLPLKASLQPVLPSPRSKLFVDPRTMLGARPDLILKRARRTDTTG